MSEDRAGASGPDDAEDLDILDDLLAEEVDGAEEPEADLEPETPTEDRPAEERRKPSSRQRAIIALRGRLEREEAERRRLQADYERLLTQQQQVAAAPSDPYRQAQIDQQEAERVAQMMPHQQAEYYTNRAEQRLQQQMLRAQVQTADMMDRQAYQALAREEPAAARYADQVEQMLALARRQNMNFSREALYNQIIAQEVRTRAKKQAEAQRAKGRREIAAQTTQPGGGRSTAAAPRRARDDTDADLDARLRNVTLGEVW